MKPAIVFVLLAACTSSGVETEPLGSHGGSAPPPPGDIYRIAVDHTVGAEGEIHGVDSDGQGNLWIAYWVDGNRQQNVLPVTTLVHWNPTTRERLATFTYDDLWAEASGLALVDGELWLNYEDDSSDTVLRVIDPTAGTIVRTLGTTGIELAAMSSGRTLLTRGYDEVDVIDATSGGTEASITTSFTDGTQQGIAWRPGEIWVGGWFSPAEIYDEHGALLGTVDAADLRAEAAYPMHHLAFDGDLLLLGVAGQLTWYRITP